MKKRFFTLFICIAHIFVGVMADSNLRPMLKDGKRWVYAVPHLINEHELEPLVVTAKIDGDTIIEGEPYKKVFEKYEKYYNTEYEYCSAVQEVDGKVYYYSDFLRRKEMLYDFNLKVGDSFVVNDPSSVLYVLSIDSIFVNGRCFKRFTTKFKHNSDLPLESYELVGCWVEGIGSCEGLFFPRGNDLNNSNMGFLECWEDDICIFRKEDFKASPQKIYDTEYDSLVNGDFQWTMRYDIVSPAGGVNYEEIKFYGDMLISGDQDFLYKKVWNREWREGEPKPVEWQERKGLALGQDGGKVYLTGKGLIMDFSAQVGDVVKINELDAGGTLGISYKVEAISDTVFVSSTDKKRRRCLHVRNVYYPSGTDIWVEGIGSLKYGIGGDRTYYGGAWSQLMECRRGDEILYRKEDYSKSVSKVHAIADYSVPVYHDLQGRQLTSQPRKGIYIRDGRKVVVK